MRTCLVSEMPTAVFQLFVENSHFMRRLLLMGQTWIETVE